MAHRAQAFCPYRTLTVTPKSGEVDVQVAPRLATASMASTASAELGK